MPANGGYRVFNTGDVLTAAQVQYYLQNQTVMYFATTTARDAVLTGATLVEGMVSYTPSTGLVVYNGSAWVSAGTASPLTTKGDVWGYSTTNARVPVGSDGQVLTADSTQALGVKWATASSGTTTWTLRKTPTASAVGLSQIAYNGTNLYVGVGYTGTLFTSPDGITWTSRTSGFGANNINGVAYGNGVWVAVGDSGVITSSTDGITWTARTSGLGTGQIHSVVYANSLFVAVGQNSTGPAAGITTSPDGTTWTSRTVTGTIGTMLYGVAYGNGYFLAVASTSTNNAAYSTNGTTWTAVNIGPASSYVNCLYTNGFWFAFANTQAGMRYVATNPTGTWGNANTISLNTGYDYKTIGATSSRVYWLNTANSTSGSLNTSYPALQSISASFTVANYPDSLSAPIFLPATDSVSNSNITSLYVNSTGQFIITDAVGRIYTSF